MYVCVCVCVCVHFSGHFADNHYIENHSFAYTNTLTFIDCLSALWLGIPIPGSRTIFSIPNPGIGDALIPGFRDYENEHKMPEFYMIFARKIPFSRILGANSRL